MKQCLLVTLSFFILNFCLACSCAKRQKISASDVEGASHIFIGKVIKSELHEKNRKFTFQVITKLKPDIADTVEIWTGLGGGDCGLNFLDGQEWYIFAKDSEGKSWSGRCGRSALMSVYVVPKDIVSKKHIRAARRSYKKSKKRAVREVKFVRKVTWETIERYN